MEGKLLKWKLEDGIGLLTINSPDTLNSLNTQVLKELEAWLEKVDPSELKVLIISGEGKAFVAGADIGEMANLSEEEALAFGKLGSRIFRGIEKLPLPVIAAINGFALGGGCELALACDIRLASTRAKLGQPEVGLGITPGFSGTVRLPRLIGPGRAKELIYTGRIIGAQEALDMGLVNQLVEPEELIDRAYELAGEIRKNSANAVALSKEAIDRGLDMDIDSAIELENQLFSQCFSHEDQKEGMEAFLKRRKANFK